MIGIGSIVSKMVLVPAVITGRGGYSYGTKLCCS